MADEVFGPVDDPVSAVLASCAPHATDVGPGIRFRDRQRVRLLAPNARSQVARSLLRVAGAQNVGRASPPDVQRPCRPAKLALEQGERHVVKAPAAEFLGNVRRVEAERFDLPLNLATDLERHMTRPFDIGLQRVELFFDEASDSVDHHLLLVGETEVHAPVTDMMRIN